MAEIKFTRDDRTFLREMHINPESTMAEDMHDVITAPTQYPPNTIFIPQEVARLVIKEFGKLTMANYWAYRAKFGND